jgi:hypothetical protein
MSFAKDFEFVLIDCQLSSSHQKVTGSFHVLYLTTMSVFCVYPAMSKKSENLSDLDKKDRNKRHSSPFINVVKGVFFVVRVICLSINNIYPVTYALYSHVLLLSLESIH